MRLFFLISALAILLTGASTSRAQAVSAPAPRDTSAGHRLGTNDLVEVKVFQESDLTTTARVAPDGKITFPLIGQVAIEGKTPLEAARVIRDRLATRFLVDPQVSVTLVEAARRLFTVLGQVQRPGTYRFPDEQSLNLIQVIGIAGGYTRLADAGHVTVKRRGQDKDDLFRLNAKRMARERDTAEFIIQPGDLITVAERAF